MWLGWDHCGYDSISDLDPELEESMSWRPPSSGRGDTERAQLLGPVEVPGGVLDRGAAGVGGGRGETRHPRFPHVGVNSGPGGAAGAGGPGMDMRRASFRSHNNNNNNVEEGGRPAAPAPAPGPAAAAAAGSAMSSFWGGTMTRKPAAATPAAAAAAAAAPPPARSRFLSEDNSSSFRIHDHHHRRHPSFFFGGSGGGSGGSGDGGGGSGMRRRHLWQNFHWGGTRSLDEGRRASDVSGSTSFGHALDGGSGGSGTAPAKIPDIMRVAFFDPDYDTSRQHLEKLFNSLDTNGSGTITYEAMRMGLANLGTYSDLTYLMRRVEMDKSKEISLDEFVEIVQDYSEKMFAAKKELPVRCFCYDYSPEDVAFRWVKTGDTNPPSPSVSLRTLMAERGDEKGDVRWVCVTGSDPSLVIHMANRYGIHPLQVEDCLNPKERLKVDAFRAPLKPARESTKVAAAAATVAAEEEAVAERVAAAEAKRVAAETAAAKEAAAAAAAAAGKSEEAEEEEAAAATAATAEAGARAAGARAAGAGTAAGTAIGAATPTTAAAATAAEEAAKVAASPAAAGKAVTKLHPSAAGRPPVRPTATSDVERRAGVASVATDAAGAVEVPDGGKPEAKPPTAGSRSGSGSSSGGSNGGVDRTEELILHVLLGRISLRSPTAGRPSNFEREQVSIFLVGDHTVLFIEPTPSGVSDQISNRIYYAGSKLRLNNARYLVYSLMDSIVDDVFPIMQHFQAWLVQLQEQLHSVDDGPSLEIVRAIQQISRDMHMITFYLRPMKMVAIQLIADLAGNDADLKRHLEDLRDHLLMLEEQALRMSTWSRSLNKDWVNEQQHRMNQVVYILTMVTSAFMPAQFLTGVFGMNFKFMPELNWRYSYASFWVLVALLAFTSYTVYKRHKWL